MAGQTITDNSVVQVGYGTDDGVTLATSGGKLGFYGSAAPVALQTCTVANGVVATSTTTVCNNAVIELYTYLKNLNLIA
jgi:hypothetical protein